MPLNVVLTAQGKQVFKLIASSCSTRADVMGIDGALTTDFAGLIFDKF